MQFGQIAMVKTERYRAIIICFNDKIRCYLLHIVPLCFAH